MSEIGRRVLTPEISRAPWRQDRTGRLARRNGTSELLVSRFFICLESRRLTLRHGAMLGGLRWIHARAS
jgi:hypothetical protein